jgi:ABC-type Na+ efflux pump permease subunit
MTFTTMTFTTMTFTTNHQQGDRMNIELTTAQFLGLAALAIAGGVAFGIAIGIRLYERCCK